MDRKFSPFANSDRDALWVIWWEIIKPRKCKTVIFYHLQSTISPFENSDHDVLWVIWRRCLEITNLALVYFVNGMKLCTFHVMHFSQFLAGKLSSFNYDYILWRRIWVSLPNCMQQLRKKVSSHWKRTRARGLLSLNIDVILPIIHHDLNFRKGLLYFVHNITV